MKKHLLILLLSIGTFSFAQSGYEKSLTDNITKLNLAKESKDYSSLKKEFSALIAPTNDWYANYYAALSAIKEAEYLTRLNKTDGVDLLASEAEGYLELIKQPESNNSEVRVLQAYIHMLKMAAATDSGKYAEERKKTSEILYSRGNTDNTNPRLDLVRAQFEVLLLKNRTHNKNLKYLFQNAGEKLKAFKPKTKFDPNWGLKDAEYYISLLK